MAKEVSLMDTSPAAQRIGQLRHGMREQGVDALLCMKPASFFYLSGFNPIVFSHPVVAILPLEGEPTLLMHALRDDHARHSSWVKDIRLHGAWSTKKTMGMDWLAALRSILEERGVLRGKLGIDGDFMPASTLRKLEERLPESRFVDASELIMESRMIKDAAEIEAMRIAARISDIGMEAAIAAARSRKSERAISIEAMAAMNRVWLEDYPDIEAASFGGLESGVHNSNWAFCLTGDHVQFNADNPTLRVPADGEIALIIAHGTCNGMIGENERSVAVGRLDDQRRKMYEAVLQVREETLPAIRPGISCAGVFGVAKTVYERLGYGKYLPGRIGHGMGLGAHEHPSFGPNDQTLLRPGVIMSFEPGLRIPELGGLQHSDTVLVTETGSELLTKTERGFIQI